LDGLQTLLSEVKESQRRGHLTEEGTCHLCCHSFSVRGIIEDGVASIVTYNGARYHSFCINFWLNKVMTTGKMGQGMSNLI
jgi:hypothetical protein